MLAKGVRQMRYKINMYDAWFVAKCIYDGVMKLEEVPKRAKKFREAVVSFLDRMNAGEEVEAPN